MASNIARYGFALVAVAACAGAVIRIATAPDRIKERRQTAQQVCADSGGRWERVDGNEVCIAAESAGQR